MKAHKLILVSIFIIVSMVIANAQVPTGSGILKTTTLRFENRLPYDVLGKAHPVIKSKVIPFTVGHNSISSIQVSYYERINPTTNKPYKTIGLVLWYIDPVTTKKVEMVQEFPYTKRTIVIAKPDSASDLDPKVYKVISFPAIVASEPYIDSKSPDNQSALALVNKATPNIRVYLNNNSFEGTTLAPSQSCMKRKTMKSGVMDVYVDVLVSGNANVLYRKVIKKFITEGVSELAITDEDLVYDLESIVRMRVENKDRVPIMLYGLNKKKEFVSYEIKPGKSQDVYFLKGTYMIPVTRPNSMSNNYESNDLCIIVAKSSKIQIFQKGAPARYQ